MKWDVKLYVGGKVFNEQVHAINMQDARETALARNPKAKVISVNATFK
mgnify:FL=1|tara:strand:+ start:230 stop:373 length:144 start_codon:yes stop_codon:yes gene_type:complete